MKAFTIIMGIFLIIGGVLVFSAPLEAFLSIIWLLGILLIITGVNIIADHFIMKQKGMRGVWDLIGGIVTILLGIVVIYGHFSQIAISMILVVAFASWVLISGIIRIIVSFQHRKLGDRVWIWIFIMGVISILLGLYGIANPVMLKLAMGFMIGFFLMMQGINMLGLGFAIGKIGGPNDNDKDK